MAERLKPPPGAGTPILQVAGLNVFYGRSHALQGVDLTLRHGVLSVVGRNGMGKTTLCKAIMGLVPVSSGSIRFFGEEIAGHAPAEVARLGIGYVPQGRRLWRSLTVDEHLRVMQRGKRGAWTPERIYEVFPRLAERRGNGGAQLSGGEQQMLAISRALLMNPRLLLMDEPTEGLAPVIVAQVEEMLVRLADQGDVAILVIEQNIGVATQMSDPVAIMVNGRINRIIASATLAGDRDLQQSLLGVGRHSHDETDGAAERGAAGAGPADPAPAAPTGPTRVYIANPAPPTRWSQPVPAARIEAQARTISRPTLATRDGRPVGEVRPLAAAAAGEPYVMIAGTLDTKGEELRFIRDLIGMEGLRTRLVDLSTSGRSAGGDVTPQTVALAHPKGSTGIASGDRGAAVAAMTEAFAAWLPKQEGLLGIISAGGSGATAMVTPAMQALPVGLPKVMISTMASGDVRAYVGASDITMMHAVTDVQGLNRVSRLVLGNGARAVAAMAKSRLADLRRETSPRRGEAPEKSLVGMTMFGVTTPCVQQVSKLLAAEWEPLVFHATGTGGRAMEKLIDSGLLGAVIDVSTTEICDMMMGGFLPATDDRFGAVIRSRIPYVGSVGALDMVNFFAPETVPERYRARTLHPHNPQITLMRTTADENARMGRWIGERLNQMEGPVRFLIPERGVSALDAPGKPFHDPMADAALFEALEQTVRVSANRQLIRLPHHINDPAFAAALVQHFRALHAGRRRERATGGRA